MDSKSVSHETRGRADLLVSGLREQIRPAVPGILLLTLLTGIAFPLALAGLAFPLFSHQARGSLVTRDGAVVGAELIGQNFSGPGYFHPRPSAAGDGYDATASGGTNLGPANPKLRDGEKGDPDATGKSKSFTGVRELAEVYRRSNGLSPGSAVPIDAVTRSASGLDPHISPANAVLQVPRVALERKLNEEEVRRLVDEHTQGRQFGFLGEPRVAVLPLNLALDQLALRFGVIPR
jgi:K+-transporting ATPase ATPase C chain